MSSIFHFPFSITGAAAHACAVMFLIVALCYIACGLHWLCTRARAAWLIRRTARTCHTTDTAAFGAPHSSPASHPSHPLRRQMLKNILTTLQRHN
jgi:hypothetical protein